MIITTTPNIEGKPASVYLGIVAVEVIYGAMFLKDWLAQGTDLVGGRNHIYEKVYADARTAALKALEEAATKRGANAVLSARVDYQVLGENNGMLMCSASGTAVGIPFTDEERKQEAESEVEHYLDLAGQRRGPFSIEQLRQLLASGHTNQGALTYAEDGTAGRSLGELLGT